MGSQPGNAAIGYFWIIIVLVFVGLIWWKIDSILYKDEVCILQQGFKCEKKRLYLAGESLRLDLTVRNKLGRWIEITGIMCSSEVPDPAIGRPQGNFEEFRVNAVPDSVFSVSGFCQRGQTDKDPRVFKGIVYLRYEFKDEPYVPGSQVVVGNVRGSVIGN